MENKTIKRSVVGILAHVDAGKTTLSEAMLYSAGELRTMGRVDHGNAFLDNFNLERARGITIFSKQACLNLPGLQVTLLDTPGHVDFSPEMERTLNVLDAAILVISAPAGVQSHTITVWKLLREHNIPTFIFVNKTDLPGKTREEVMEELKSSLGEGCTDIHAGMDEKAMADEFLLEEFLETGTLKEESIKQAIWEARLFPCWFGAALRLSGVTEFLDGLGQYLPETREEEAFSARVYKITRDPQGTRLTHMKVTGGVLKVRETLAGADFEEKITALRVYAGAKFKTVDVAYPGDVVAAVGLTRTAPGMTLGAEAESMPPTLEPVLTYRVILPPEIDAHRAMMQFRELEEEEPQLHVDWNSRLAELRVRIMGEVQLEVLHELVHERFGYEVSFDQGSILYRETIAAPVEGVGHYEPLRHYAEVHLLMEPAARGSGITIDSLCREDDLDGNWQRLIMTHLMEKQHVGVLTGSPITDINIHLVSGRAHLKHTEGGDFREATYRAVRQGLMSAESVLLEPWYSFRIELPENLLGRALTDLDRRGASFDPPESNNGMAVITGRAPAESMRDYAGEITAYSRGMGRFTTRFAGYEPCHDSERVIAEIGYEAERDVENSADSIFCAHGAGFPVKWNKVPGYMHLPSVFEKKKEIEEEPVNAPLRRLSTAGDEELMRIFEQTYGPIRDAREKAMRPTEKANGPVYRGEVRPTGPEYLLIDGYNIIFAWEELEKLARDNLEHAREVLIDRMRNYQGVKKSPVILVFDAYKVKGNHGSVEHYGDVAVVYTKEAETADMYIEKVTRELGKRHRVRVATSDGLEQIIILSHGALRVPASEFHDEVKAAEEAIRKFLKEQKSLIPKN